MRLEMHKFGDVLMSRPAARMYVVGAQGAGNSGCIELEEFLRISPQLLF